MPRASDYIVTISFGNILYCVLSCTVAVLTCVVMCGCVYVWVFVNMYTSVYCILYCLYCVFVLFRICTFIVVCFASTSCKD